MNPLRNCVDGLTTYAISSNQAGVRLREYTDAVSVAAAFTQPASITVQAIMPARLAGCREGTAIRSPPRNSLNQDCYSGCGVKPDNSKL
ncbi:hypothetical protein C7421_103229 [Pantoea ananatis]|nr:hypothetical protein C7421_103229 [Pantoea ananatis]